MNLKLLGWKLILTFRKIDLGILKGDPKIRVFHSGWVIEVAFVFIISTHPPLRLRQQWVMSIWGKPNSRWWCQSQSEKYETPHGKSVPRIRVEIEKCLKCVDTVWTITSSILRIELMDKTLHQLVGRLSINIHSSAISKTSIVSSCTARARNASLFLNKLVASYQQVRWGTISYSVQQWKIWPFMTLLTRKSVLLAIRFHHPPWQHQGLPGYCPAKEMGMARNEAPKFPQELYTFHGISLAAPEFSLKYHRRSEFTHLLDRDESCLYICLE